MNIEHYGNWTLHTEPDGGIWFHRSKWPASYGKHADTVHAAKAEIDEIEIAAAARLAAIFCPQPRKEFQP